mgnify:CR=1 FL=1
MTRQLQVLEAGQAMALSPAAVIVPASLALFTQSKKVDLGILKDSWIVLDFTQLLSIALRAGPLCCWSDEGDDGDHCFGAQAGQHGESELWTLRLLGIS